MLRQFSTVLLFAFLLVCSSCKQDYYTKLRVGIPVPELSSLDIEGQAVDLKEFRNHYVYIYFWASWCAPCGDAFPDYMMLNDKYSKLQYKDAEGFVFLPISVDDKEAKWRKAIDKWELNFEHQWCDLKGMPSELSERFQFDKVPSSLLINPEGVIIGRDIGFSDLVWELKERVQ